MTFDEAAIAIVMGIAALAAAGGHLYAAHIARRARAARDWPTVTATVEKSSFWAFRGDSMPLLAYVYQVDGRSYRGGRLQFGGWTAGPGAAEAFAARHPAGSTLQVRYDPDRPSRAVVEARANPGAYRLAGWGVAMGFTITALLIYFDPG